MGTPLIDLMTARKAELQKEIDESFRVWQLQIQPKKDELEKFEIAVNVAKQLDEPPESRPLTAATKDALAQEKTPPKVKPSLTAHIVDLVSQVDSNQEITSHFVYSMLFQRGVALPEKNAKVQITNELNRLAAKGGINLVKRGDAANPSIFKKKG